MAKVYKSLQELVETHKNIQEVHFTADGKHHLRAFQHKGNLYTRLDEVPEKTAAGIHTGKSILVPIAGMDGKDHPDYRITETMTREDILNATPVPDEDPNVLAIRSAMDTLSITPEEYEAFMASRNKRKK